MEERMVERQSEYLNPALLARLLMVSAVTSNTYICLSAYQLQ